MRHDILRNPMCDGTRLSRCSTTAHEAKDVECTEDTSELEGAHDALTVGDVGKVVCEGKVVNEDGSRGWRSRG